MDLWFIHPKIGAKTKDTNVANATSCDMFALKSVITPQLISAIIKMPRENAFLFLLVELHHYHQDKVMALSDSY